MNNLERDSKQYDVLMMETSTQEKTVRDGEWYVPVKHVAKLSRMRGSTSTNTNINFLLIQRKRTETMTQHQIAWGQNSYNCSCCEAGGMQWKRTRNFTTKRTSVRFSSLTDADINFFEKGNTDLCELQPKTWAPKPLVCQSFWLSIQELEKQSCH